MRRVFWHITQWRRRGGDRRRLARLLHFNSTWSVDALPDTPYCRRKTAPRHQELADSEWWWSEPDDGQYARRKTKRWTPQGSPLSPALANIYFRRFLLAWRDHGHQDQPMRMDFVIRCRPASRDSVRTK